MKAIKLLTALLVVALFTLSSCKKDGPTTLTLQVSAKYGTQGFATHAANKDAAGRFIEISTLEFYLSHISLIKTDGSKLALTDVAVFNFNDSSTLSVSFKNIQGDFTGLSFGCGLDSAQNNSNPNDYQAPNPLSADYGMAWPMIQKYQFESIEGKWDTAVMPIMRNGLVYHIGTNQAYRTTQLNKIFSVKGSPTTLVLYLDVAQIFNNTTTGETLDIVTEPTSQSGSTDNPVILTTFADNFSKAFTF